MHLICRHCSTRLSNELKLVSLSQRNENVGEDLLLRGTLMQDDGAWFHKRSGEYIANTEDVIQTHLTDDYKRLSGCCGLDGCDGPNLQCNGCGAYVATKMTDCWRSHCVFFDKVATEAIST
ncbi:hypothetical protein [Granulicella sp. S156]|jgi:hypothetical protein|uniref:hypothetical protein n=1 Tax=Granulicella sp. S156 TaxID=1747224 RepID=UPI00131BB783|nr:hypothetical protein [Granulicella sp. S156]